MRSIIRDAESVLGSPLRNLTWILGFVAAVASASTIAYVAAGWSLIDASYMVVLTVFSVGYGEVRPIDTPYLHAVTMLTMVLGCTGMILFTGALVQYFTELQIRQIFGANRMENEIQKLSGHVVICGYGRIGMMLAKDLKAAGMPLVVIERGGARHSEAQEAGYMCITGDATEEDVLIHAGVERARALATVLPDDAANVFISLSARALNPEIEIIARGEAPTTERKLRNAGADHVIFPTHIGAERIARMILFPASEGLDTDERLGSARREVGALGLDLERVVVSPDSAMSGLTVEAAERIANGALFVVEIERAGGRRIARPARDETIEGGDTVTVLLRDTARAARTLFTARREMRAGRIRF
ncbi:potassium channel family protein [Sphingomonas canadensis]|uniref:Potassium channel family protein n=1 Tax=Sphingomonas canadensis TaxID=1219257 RepID=A0ABW3HCK8_9SPHN|nr:potassium channel protein [Sphingomonas canadensis]MCW3836802.1 NAD-binding protein [Sphingomonas canadensis]